MKMLSASLTALLITGTQALASGGANAEGSSLLTTFFIAFGAMIILFQLIPGMTLFFGMLKGIFSSDTTEAQKAANGKGSR